jgi:ABC-2 type transport system permease protein
MNKYWVVLVTRIKEDLAYRVNYVIGALMRFIPMVTTVFLWYAVYHSGPSAGGTKAGMTFEEVVAYYLLVYIARGFSSMPGMSQEISREIKDGQLNRYLVRPIRYFWYQVAFRMAHKVVFWLVAFVAFPPVFYLMRGYFTHFPTGMEWAASILLLAVGFAVGVLFSFLIGTLAFWFLEISTFLFIIMSIELFASGHLVPLNFLPDAVQRVVLYLPFAYEAYWPCAVVLGKVPGGELSTVLGVGLVWILVLYGLCQAVWSLGLRRYSAVGG